MSRYVDSEGRVLASVDMEEIVKMTITDDIEKSNFNPQMLKSCTDTSYQCGYQKGKADAIEELVGRILSNCTLKSTGKIVLEIRMDIFKFIVNKLKHS